MKRLILFGLLTVGFSAAADRSVSATPQGPFQMSWLVK